MWHRILYCKVLHNIGETFLLCVWISQNFLYVEDMFRIDYKYFKICIMLNAINWFNNYHILSPVPLNIYHVTRGLFVIVVRSCHPLNRSSRVLPGCSAVNHFCFKWLINDMFFLKCSTVFWEELQDPGSFEREQKWNITRLKIKS